jgi:hypothetical protein
LIKFDPFSNRRQTLGYGAHVSNILAGELLVKSVAIMKLKTVTVRMEKIISFLVQVRSWDVLNPDQAIRSQTRLITIVTAK